MIVWAASFLLLGLISSFVNQQSPVKSSTALPPIQRMEEWINIGSASERVERLTSLGVDRESAQEVVQTKSVVLKWGMIAGQPKPTAILFLPCVADSASLYVLKETDENWHVSDDASFDCHYDLSVALELEQVKTPGRDELLVHHAAEGHGSGFLQQNFKIFAVSDGKLKEELDTEEVVKASPAGTDPKDLLQSSVFVVVPVSGSPSNAIEETRSTRIRGLLTVKRRVFRWDPASSRYKPTKFSRVAIQ